MPLKTIATGRALMGARSYADKVLGYGPIAYWPLWETSGTVAECLVNPLQNGTYNSNVATWPPGVGIGDGYTAPTFDGANDVVSINTATFSAAFNGSEGTVNIWWKVANVGVWTDGTQDFHLHLYVDGNNWISAFKAGAANTMYWQYRSGGINQTITWAAQANVDWVTASLTWSKTANQVKGYKNGTQIDVTKVGLGVWAGVFSNAVIGAQNGLPALVWNGTEAHCAVWNRALSQPEIADLATV